MPDEKNFELHYNHAEIRRASPKRDDDAGASSESDAGKTSGADLAPGSLIDQRYKVISELGRGGMGRVYLVEQIYLRAKYALKTLNQEHMSESALLRFTKEARTLGLVDHPGMVKVHDFGTFDGHPFYVMDLVQGESLADRIRTAGPLPVDETLHTFIQLSFVLAYAHDKGIIHRDLKPSNIMISNSDTTGRQIKVVDFGIAKILNESESALTKTGEIFGSPFYMSPEQCVGVGVDNRSDIYSIGCVMFEALAGFPPFLSDNPLSIMMKHQNESAPTLREATLGKVFPPEIEAVVAKLLQKDPDKRYQHFLSLASDLNRIAAGRGDEISRPNKAVNKTSPSAVEQVSKRRVALPVAVAIMAMCGLAGYGFALSQAGFSSAVHNNIANAGIVSGGTSPTVKQDSSVPLDSSNSTFDDFPKSALDKLRRTKNGVSLAAPENPGKYSTIIDRKTRVFRFPSYSIGELRSLHGTKVFTQGNRKELTASADAVGIVTVFDKTDYEPLNLRLSEAGLDRGAIGHFQESDLSVLELPRNGGMAILAEDEMTAKLEAFLKPVVELTGLEELSIAQQPFSDKVIPLINKLPNLKVLQVNLTRISGNSLVALTRLGQFRYLKLDNDYPVGKLLRDPRLRKSTALVRLGISRCNLDDSDLACIADMKNLEVLTMEANPEITATGLSHFSKLQRLTFLNLLNCGGLKPNADLVSIFKTLPKLTTLYISPTNVGVAEQAVFARQLKPIEVYWKL